MFANVEAAGRFRRQQFGGFTFPNEFNQFQNIFPNQNQFQNQNQFPNQGFNNQNQGFNNNQNRPNNQQPTPRPTQRTTQAAVTPSTTISPAVARCIEGCITTTPAQYNPVCGTDNVSYFNEQRLLCEQDCGRSE